MGVLMTCLLYIVIYLLIGVIAFGFMYVYSDTNSYFDIINLNYDDLIAVWILWIFFLFFILFEKISKQYLVMLENKRNKLLKK